MVHCATERQAKEVLAALEERMAEVGLQLHPDKTRIVFCKDGKRRYADCEHTSFTFLGYTFRARNAPRPFKKARRWWHELTARQPRMFAHWAWMNEF